MISALIDFQFKDILNYAAGFLAFALFFIICYFIGRIGVRIRTGVKTLNYFKKIEIEAKKKGMVLTEKGNALKTKGRHKIVYPLFALITIYLLLFIFVPSKYFPFCWLALLPVILGYFGIFLVPEQTEDFFEE